jgi:diguanylate cyclase (GGDEF)-like protein/PAS domain S-box-containing protein
VFYAKVNDLLASFSAWLGRLSVSRKLILIYVLDLTAVFYVSGILIHEKYLAIDFARKEIVGVAYTTAVREMLLTTMQGERTNSAQDLQALQQLKTQQNRLDALLNTQTESNAFVRAWNAQAGQAKPLPAALKPVIDNASALITTVGNQSNLILDPDLDSYYMMSLCVLRFPALAEVLNETMQVIQVRDHAADVKLGMQNAALLVLAGRLDAVHQGIESDFKQAYVAAGPALQQKLLVDQQFLDALLLQLIDLVQHQAFADNGPPNHQMSDALTARLLGQLGRVWGQSSTLLDDMLQARVDGLFARMWLHLGTALVLLLGIFSLVYTVARLISRPLKQLAVVADEVRQSGNYNLRAQWHSWDEIGHLVTTFNDMLAQLDQDRMTQQEQVVNARAAQAQMALLEATPIAMVVTSIPDHVVLHANAPALPWLNGRTTDPWQHGLEPGVRARFFQRLSDHDKVDEFEVRWHGGLEPSWAVLSARRLSFQGVDAVITTFTPINVLKVMEQRLELWAKVFEASSEGIIIMDAQQSILSVNHAFCRATQYDFYEVLGEHLKMLLHDVSLEGVPPLTVQIERTLEQRNDWQGEVNLRKRSGETYPAWLMISAVRESVKQDCVSHYIGISIDITDRKRTEARVQFLAHHDVLTELPNRKLCTDTLRQVLEEAQVSGERVAVLFIDLDRFKNINDTLGHHVGDGLLRSVAERLKQTVRTGDMVSRLGGDEFVVILRGLGKDHPVRLQVEQRLIPLIRQPHQVEGHTLNVSCSVGIAMCPDDGHDLDELMRRADAAMYEAKSSGRDAACVFEPAIDFAIRERQTLEQHLRLALERGEFTLNYQPRLDAATRVIVGVEALIRWHSAELGQVSPARFIPVAEETGLISQIGLWVMTQACAQWTHWQAAGWAPLGMSINLSAAQLADPDLVQLVRLCIEKNGCDPKHLEFEITESHLMADAREAADQLNAIKALGLQLSIDDFGTGYSSLAYLKRFPIDKLKIDQSFVRDMLDDPADLAIVRATIALGHTLGLRIVAEGVELAEQADLLQKLGCDELQGYYFAKPLTAQALVTWMESGQNRLDERCLPTIAPRRAV